MAHKQIPDRPQYSQDKPTSCEYCYFWQGKKYGCEMKSCYYLRPEEPNRQQPTGEVNCKDCSYGKHSPCIGYCLVKIMQELKVGRYAE